MASTPNDHPTGRRRQRKEEEMEKEHAYRRSLESFSPICPTPALVNGASGLHGPYGVSLHRSNCGSQSKLIPVVERRRLHLQARAMERIGELTCWGFDPSAWSARRLVNGYVGVMSGRQGIG